MYNVQCTNVQGTGYNVQGTGYNVQGTGYNVQCTNLEDGWKTFHRKNSFNQYTRLSI